MSLGLLYLYSLQGKLILNRFETFCMIVSQCYVMTVQITAASKKKIFFFLPFHAQLNPQLFLLLYYIPFTKLKIKNSHSLKPHYSPSVLDGKICFIHLWINWYKEELWLFVLIGSGQSSVPDLNFQH